MYPASPSPLPSRLPHATGQSSLCSQSVLVGSPFSTLCFAYPFTCQWPWGCAHVLAVVNHPAVNTGETPLSVLKWNGWITWYFCAWHFFDNPPYCFPQQPHHCVPVKSLLEESLMPFEGFPSLCRWAERRPRSFRRRSVFSPVMAAGAGLPPTIYNSLICSFVYTLIPSQCLPSVYSLPGTGSKMMRGKKRPSLHFHGAQNTLIQSLPKVHSASGTLLRVRGFGGEQTTPCLKVIQVCIVG